MGYNIVVLKKEDYKTSLWSGGTTTELLIFPPEADYSKGNFKWRLSSANVNVEASTFTNLPGISRIIMVLQGKLLLEHEGHHKASLKAFQQDSFSGDWVTNSYGKVTDFNLMMAEGCKGKLEIITMKAAENIELSRTNEKNLNEYNNITEVFYCVNGEVEVVTKEDKSLKLLQGDLAYISWPINEERIFLRLFNEASSEAKLIRSTIYY
jgi:uncharacterized protein